MKENKVGNKNTLKKLAVFTILVFFCTFYSNAQNRTQPATHIYIAGAYMDGNTQRACYWKDGERMALDGNNAVGIIAANGQVYVVGTYINDKNGNRSNPCYWINGQRNGIDDFYGWSASGNIFSMAVINREVYSVGYMSRSSETTYHLWINGLRNQTFKTPSNYITTIDGVSYITGGNGSTRSAYYSAYGQSVTLDGNEAFGITVENGMVYVAGYYRDGDNYKPCYWIDGVRRNLPGNGRATRIAIVNGTVHIIGDNYSNREITEAYYWVNDGRVEIPNASRFSSIKTFDGNVYITGTFKQGAINIACYWVNGERFIIPGGRTASDIFIAME